MFLENMGEDHIIEQYFNMNNGKINFVGVMVLSPIASRLYNDFSYKI